MMAKISREISATGDDLKRLSANSHSVRTDAITDGVNDCIS